MKNAGIILIITGVIFMFINGFSWIKPEKVLEIGNLEVIKNEEKKVNWSPIVGVILFTTGAILLISKKT